MTLKYRENSALSNGEYWYDYECVMWRDNGQLYEFCNLRGVLEAGNKQSAFIKYFMTRDKNLVYLLKFACLLGIIGDDESARLLRAHNTVNNAKELL